jgi:pimeloyl-ACP methyl ester carboxylesterase
VRGVAALAPWVLPGDRPHGAVGSRVLVVHGARDRIASPARSLALAAALEREAEVTYVCVEEGRHAMLREHSLFDGLAAQFAAATLLGTAPAGPLARLPAGESFVRL